MNKKNAKGLLKHWDFILVDFISLQIAYTLAYWLFNGIKSPYNDARFRYLALLLVFSQLLVTAFSQNYSGILRRKKFDEAISVFKYIASIVFIDVLILFLFRNSVVASRLQLGFTVIFYFLIDLLLRLLLKARIIQLSNDERGKRSLILFTSARLVDDAIDKLYKTDSYRDYTISLVILFDKEMPIQPFLHDVPITIFNDQTLREIGHGWVDEAFILQPDDMAFSTHLLDELMTMGITVNYTMSAFSNDKWPNATIRKLGEFKVITNAVRFASMWELTLKRLMDIVGGLIGCLLTGIIFLFVAPAIYAADPGPIFFKQERIGQNGRHIIIHKFRSMYMDAEARKADLMSQNKIKDGMMFKMDDDPRIIGSEKKDKNGKPKGIGNFIRKTSLDEFPQFYDCLIGNMSLVGWRPCTLQEWEKYDLKHRIRAGMKPGITGPWQVSGRSEIVDFDEVVRLDREYIEKWNLLLDIRILLKTVVVVLTGRGAK